MASKAGSSILKSFKYDVFLSFRGEDTRKTFVDHLYHALVSKGIITYKDDERIEKGGRINDQLIKAIEESQFHIIVFSKNYASSSWCLDELVNIMECQKGKRQTAYPVFYDVGRTEVRKQIGAVGEAFAKHKKDENASRWRDALKQAAGLAGSELKNTFDGNEAKFIQQIVNDISLKLSFTIKSSTDEKLVGMETRVKYIVSSLETRIDDVRLIGITGVGGSGKTTLARAVFNTISGWFESKSFVENVKEVSNSTSSGLKKLQKQVLRDVFNDQSIVVNDVSDGKSMMKKMMPSRKVLVVLDDVDDIGQLEALAGEPTWFKTGSRIIITTRDMEVLVAHRVNFIHDVSLLSNEEAMCLFSRYAFGGDLPIHEYKELSREVVHYAAGLPLTIKVLGSHLRGKSVRDWADVIERLNPLQHLLEVVEVSYNGLDRHQKEIFLDVACILKGQLVNKAIRILESYGFDAPFALRVLEWKSLLTISHTNGLRMHDHIAEMGRNIVRRLHPTEPYKHSRLWVAKEIEHILVNDLGTEAIISMKIHYADLHPTTIMKGLRKMTELRFLYVYDKGITFETEQVDQYLPNSLQSLHWSFYPFWCLPKTFQANNLINLEMPRSNLCRLWEGGEIKVLNKLKYLDLSFSKLRTFDLSLTPHLERLDLEKCNDFVELHIPFQCRKLKYINLSGSKLRNLDLQMAPCLEELHLEKCNDFLELRVPLECQNLKYLSLSGSKLSKLHLSSAPCLKELHLKECNDLVKLEMPFECPALTYLNISGSKLSDFDLRPARYLESLDLRGCNDFVQLRIPVECPKLKYLNLSDSKLRYLHLTRFPCLEELHLEECNDFVELIMAFEMSKLKYLNLSGTKLSHLDLWLAQNLETLDLRGCNNLVKLFMYFQYPKLKYLYVSGSELSDSKLGLTPHLEWLESLEELTLSIKDIKHLPDTICMLKHLNFLELKSCLLLERLPKDLGRLDCLEKLYLTDCISLRDIPNSICKMKCLKHLHLPYCVLVEKLPEELGSLKCLKELNIEGTGITNLPKSIIELEGLCIIWSRGRLESYGFITSIKKLSRYTASGYLKKAVTTGAPSNK